MPESRSVRPAVSFEAVSKSFGSFIALDQVSFSIETGDFFALLGPNGAGKTTLISMMAGLTKIPNGKITIAGYDVANDYRNARHKIGVVPQELVFDPFFTVRETLRLQSGYFGLRKNDAWIDELLHHLGLSDKAENNMRQLSGGMKRRVLVAQALVHKPPVIVLDEPTAGVDVELRQSLWAFIQQLNQQGHTILLTTHYLEEAETLCNRIAFLKQGKLLALENKHDLLSKSTGRHVKLTFGPSTTLPTNISVQGRHLSANDWVFDLSTVAAVDELLASLRTQNIPYLDLDIRKPDLEDIFVKMMANPTNLNACP